MRGSAGLAAVWLAGALACPHAAWAATATWVSGIGTDAGDCSGGAPCRSLAFALAQTDAGGTINVLAAGSFGPLVIDKSVDIIADGVEALIDGQTGGAAITIQGASDAVVSLRGLSIKLGGPNSGSIGIRFQAGAALQVRNCSLRDVGTGISFRPATGAGELHVADTEIANADRGIHVQPGGDAKVSAILDRLHLDRFRSFGILLNTADGSAATLKAALSDSVVSGSEGRGILVAASGDATTAEIERTAILNNRGSGLEVGGGATVRIGASTVTANATGLRNAGGTLLSYRTSKIDGNGTNISGGVTPIARK
jgi:hypothetical protein